MTDQQLLAHLGHFYGLQRDVALMMADAMYMFDRNYEVHAWHCLFEWQLAKDAREEHWTTFKHYFPEAIGLKEGVKYD